MPQDPIYRLKRLFDRRPFRCAMCSMGGVGSTALARHILSVADKTVYEHAYTPAVYDQRQRMRLGYLFGDPYNAVLSVFRREFQHMHVKAMNAYSPTPAVSLKGVTIEEYLERGIDEFRIERQFDNWTNEANAKHPTVLIKYEDLSDNIDTVLAFFGVSRSFEVKRRSSSWQSQPEAIRKGLENMYGGLLAKVEAMPSIQIFPGRENPVMVSELLPGAISQTSDRAEG